MSHLREIPRRTPTGFLHGVPRHPPRPEPIGSGWSQTGSLEVGAFFDGGDERETRFGRYAERDDGVFVSRLTALLEQPERGIHGEVAGVGLGRDDGSARAAFEWAGRLRARAFFDRVPVAYAHDARTLFEGVGTARLSLAAGLTPGANSDAQLAAALAGTGERRLSVQRDRGGIALDLRVTERVKAFARFEQEERQGARPFGGGLVYELGPGVPARVVETVEPIDASTRRVRAGLQYAGSSWWANLDYRGSFFRNRIDTLTWDNPFALPATSPFATPDLVERGRFALAPDNREHAVRAEGSAPLPWRGRLTAALSWTSSQQDQDLIPPTINSGSIDTQLFPGGAPLPATIDLDDWSRPASRRRDSADARVDTWLAHVALQLSPWRRLRLGARVRYFDRNNRTRYRAFNPLTGQIGYIAEDAAPGATIPFESRVFIPGQLTEDWRFRATPLDLQRLEGEVSADLRLGRRSRLAVVYRRDEVDRDEREREETDEDRLRIRLTSRSASWATLRASYEFGRRRGDSFETDVLRRFFVSSLPGFNSIFGPVIPPRGLAQLRRPSLADLDEHRFEVRVTLLAREDMDLSVASRYRDQDYGSRYGLTAERASGATVDWSWHLSPRHQAYASLGWERARRDVAGINDAGPVSDDPNAGGAVFPLDRRWSVDAKETTWSVGAGMVAHPHERLELRSDYHFDTTNGRTAIGFASEAALASGLSAAQAGRALPDLRLRDHVVETEARWLVSESVTLRLYHRYQRSSVRDWAQRRLEPQVDGALFLGHQDGDFEVSFYGVGVELRF